MHIRLIDLNKNTKNTDMNEKQTIPSSCRFQRNISPPQHQSDSSSARSACSIDCTASAEVAPSRIISNLKDLDIPVSLPAFCSLLLPRRVRTPLHDISLTANILARAPTPALNDWSNNDENRSGQCPFPTWSNRAY